MSSSTTTSIHPIYGQPLPISTSLTSDAPGHSSASVADPKGVICWKCLGSGNVGGRLSGSKKPKKACPVCEKGRLKTKALRSSPGTVRKWSDIASVTVTKPRRHDARDEAYVKKLEECVVEEEEERIRKLLEAEPPSEGGRFDLSSFLFSYRLLQEPPGGHRYTTDDLLTAHVASLHCPASGTFRHVDLGCGNGSVLLGLHAVTGRRSRGVGVEARSQAVRIARASGAYNGFGGDVEVVRCDFRDVDALRAAVDGAGGGEGAKPNIVTGTPPYFTVSSSGSDGPNPTTAVVQGGMPTNLQSSPARCEFRGGVEAYVIAGLRLLGVGGKVVVCVNWPNRKRVYDGCEGAGGSVVEEWEVEGTRGRGPLFGVWVVEKVGEEEKERDVKTVKLTVREDGRWTQDYAEIMKNMGIPTVGVADSPLTQTLDR